MTILDLHSLKIIGLTISDLGRVKTLMTGDLKTLSSQAEWYLLTSRLSNLFDSDTDYLI